ncbi:Piso0_001651 [Millerozyma farinosa CBS 7064]|uniref:Methionine aminopeptidase n=1 Tax=Pichia sorbitophila (strain ATCC MYA-4447 / BCRC 22081 / CBS 7064 / NBRC 10061 / NRRL Y-12695) TaxID=559304 RepID=G8YLC8_PICSO|nr:Piso0_001651 [Millerozyma farinosa CBS 7064]
MPAVCASPRCGKETDSALKCPVCLKENVDSIFCNQICFRSSWQMHKAFHKKAEGSDEPYDPFPDYQYTGDLRPSYPLTPRRPIPKHIKVPDYAQDGRPISELKNDRIGKIPTLTPKEIEKIRKVGKISREILDIAASHVKPGITTDELDAIVHKECMKRNAYPSPLNYYNFPKSCCTSVNEVVCHGIPDQRKLEDGDIVNIDVTIYYLGFHSDLNETYYVGDKAKCNPEVVNLVETARECLDLAIKHVKPGVAFRNLGNIIEEHASKNSCSVVRTYCGHGTNQLFHCQPNIPHYAKNKAIGIMKPGMVFTIEPMINQGTFRDVSWPDNWTSVTQDGKYSAQFEHMMLVTEDGVEVLTARTETSPGGPIPRPSQ